LLIAVSANGTTLEDQVDQRFGRCKYFIIVDSDTLTFESIPNQGAMASGGAGIKAAQTVAAKGVKAVISGNIGPNAFDTLSAANIDTYVGASGEIKSYIQKFNRGELKKTESSNVGNHFGSKLL
jgi:predicted Fe-Mo cluster-binding NifX family protein